MHAARALGFDGSPPTGRLLTGELLQGLNEWRNIQDVVRLTFKAFHEVLRAQGDSIKALEAGLEARATRADLATTLQAKAGTVEVAARLRELELQLVDKADVADMERRAMRSEVDAALRTHMGDVYAVLNAKSDDREVKVWREQSDRQLQLLRADVARLTQQQNQSRPILDATTQRVTDMQAILAAKSDVADVDDQMRDKVSRRMFSESLSRKCDLATLDQLDAELRARVEDCLAAAERKAEAADVAELQGRTERLRQRMEADADTTAAALRTLGATFDGALAAVGTQMSACSSQQEQQRGQLAVYERDSRERDMQLVRQLETKADAAQVMARMETLADAGALLRLTADVDVMAEAVDRKAERGGLEALAGQVAPLMDLPPQVSACREGLDHLHSQHDAHVTSSQVAVESKAAVEDVNRALAEVCTELQARASAEHLAGELARQAGLNDRFAAFSSGARWVWHSGRTRAGGAVPWNEQAHNSDPSAFVWEQDKATIVVAEPGLYDLSFAIFCARRRPVVQLLVNGEPAATAVGGTQGGATGIVSHQQRLGAAGGSGATSSNGAGSPTGAAAVVHGSGGGGSSSSAASASGRDFFALPAMARLTLTCQGADEESAQGFLALHRL